MDCTQQIWPSDPQQDAERRLRELWIEKLLGDARAIGGQELVDLTAGFLERVDRYGMKAARAWVDEYIQNYLGKPELKRWYWRNERERRDLN
jgi:hypothetical protein